MSEETTPEVPAVQATTAEAKAKRSYISRKDEFVDTTADQVDAIIKQLTTDLKTAESANKVSPTPELAVQIKELKHKRIRAYNRLRKLGVNKAEMRSKAAELKKVAKSSNDPVGTPGTPETVTSVAPSVVPEAPALPSVPEVVPEAQ